jgi:hypothetical protein
MRERSISEENEEIYGSESKQKPSRNSIGGGENVKIGVKCENIGAGNLEISESAIMKTAMAKMKKAGVCLNVEERRQ